MESKSIGVMKIMLDTNVFDHLVSDSLFPDIWQALAEGRFAFLTTPIQEEEINQMTDPRRQSLLQSIPRQVVAVCDEVLQDSSLCGKHGHDQRIAETAAALADAFVTNDKTLLQWCQSHEITCRVWDYTGFVTWFIGLDEH